MHPIKRFLPFSARRMVFIALACSFLLPFLFLRGCYPFYRYGMFAEPVRLSAQAETFEIRVSETGGPRVALADSTFGITSGAYKHLLRNYYYRSGCAELFEKLRGLKAGLGLKQLTLYKCLGEGNKNCSEVCIENR